LDKTQTKELILSFRLILSGIFFWIIKVRYFTFFWLDEYNFFNVFGLEIVGTILILVGIIILHRIYPFAYSMPATVLIVLILIFDILKFGLYQYKFFREIAQYIPFLMSLMLVLISKLVESGLNYFGNKIMAGRWKAFSIITFFGFSVPFYAYISMNICGYITYEGFKLSFKFFLIFIPLFITALVFFIYFLVTVIQSFKFFLKIQKDSDMIKTVDG
jgi:hypothetical protein